MLRTISAVLFIMVSLYPCQVQSDDRWFATPPEVRQWFQNLKQPDNGNSCCGEADAYWADSFKAKGDQYLVMVTDERPPCVGEIIPPQCVLNRPHVNFGTEILVPNNKIQYSAGNPTGHGVIFIKWNDETDSYSVLCYVVPGGG